MRSIAIAAVLGVTLGALMRPAADTETATSSTSILAESLQEPRQYEEVETEEQKQKLAAARAVQLETLWQSKDRLVTGVTVSEDGRVFLNFPFWYPDRYEGAVAELTKDGTLTPYPDAEWNNWRLDDRTDDEKNPRQRFVCVQSVVCDGNGSLYALDPGAPWETGLLPGAPKLVKINLARNEVERIYAFDTTTTPKGSYLNDIRFDLANNFAYMTDSGDGALVVLNLESGKAWRMLDDHNSTQAEDVTLTINDKPLYEAKTSAPVAIHSDGIAYDPQGDMVYYHALTGYHTYRISARVLRENADDAADSVEDLGRDVATDGMHLDAEGNLYFTAIEEGAIYKRDAHGKVSPVILNDTLPWPDTLAISHDGFLYITTSQIHLTPRFTGEWKLAGDGFGVHRAKLNIKGPEQHRGKNQAGERKERNAP